MSSLRWKEKCIVIPQRVWSSPSKRRIPRLMVEGRASEVALKVFLKDVYFWFQETGVSVKKLIDLPNKIALKPYKNRYLLPRQVGGKSLLRFLKKRPIYIFRLADGQFYYAVNLTGEPLPKDEDDDDYLFL